MRSKHHSQLPTAQIITFLILRSSTYRANHYFMGTTVIYLPYKSLLSGHYRHLPTAQIPNFWTLPSSTYRANHHILSTTGISLPHKSPLSGHFGHLPTAHIRNIPASFGTKLHIPIAPFNRFWHQCASTYNTCSHFLINIGATVHTSIELIHAFLSICAARCIYL